MTAVEKIQIFDDKSSFLLFDLASSTQVEGPQADGTFNKAQALAYAEGKSDLAVTGFWSAQ